MSSNKPVLSLLSYWDFFPPHHWGFFCHKLPKSGRSKPRSNTAGNLGECEEGKIEKARKREGESDRAHPSWSEQSKLSRRKSPRCHAWEAKPYLFISVYLAVSNLFWMRCLKYSFSLCFSLSTPQMRGGLWQGCAFPSPILSNKYLKGEAESTAALVLSQALNLDKEVWKDLLHLHNSRRLVPCAVGRGKTKSKQERTQKTDAHARTSTNACKRHAQRRFHLQRLKSAVCSVSDQHTKTCAHKHTHTRNNTWVCKC